MGVKLVKNIFSKSLQNDIYITLLFGLLSVVFRFINFNIPGTEGIKSDLRELPLLIAIIHLSRPYYSIGLSALSSASFSLNSSQYLYTFLGHAIPLFVLWYFFRALKKQKFNSFKNALISFLLVLVYYLISMLLILLSPNLTTPGIEKNFVLLFKNLFISVSFEMTYTALAISFYYVQNKVRAELENHKENLEKTIEERTEHLHSVIEELKNTQTHLVQSERMASLGNLTAGIAHEINNPLNFISGGIGMLQDIKPQIEKSISDDSNQAFSSALEIMTEGLDRSVHIVNALTLFSRKGESRIEDYNINTIIDNTLLFMVSSMPNNIAVEKDYKLNSLVPVYIEKMHQVFINILNNAVFALSFVHNMERKITIRTYQNGNSAVVEIHNTGPQIPLDYINQIFDPFFTTKDPDNGKGLGLSICYTYIQELKGKIGAINAPNGVTFRIELPL